MSTNCNSCNYFNGVDCHGDVDCGAGKSNQTLSMPVCKSCTYKRYDMRWLLNQTCTIRMILCILIHPIRFIRNTSDYHPSYFWVPEENKQEYPF